MHKRIAFLFVILTLALFGCTEDRITSPEQPNAQTSYASDEAMETLAWNIVQEAGWEVDSSEYPAPPMTAEGHQLGCPLHGFERSVIVDDIVHYRIKIRVGHGPFDYIGIHRVVREPLPFRPIRTAKTIFLQHGDIKDFTGMFLPGVSSPRISDDFGLAVTLAQGDVDVWGIDQSWTLVPANVSDLSFMADWGLDRNIRDLEIGLRLARLVRLIGGNGLSPMPLLGYSSGASTAIALIGEETQVPPRRRLVSAFVAGDFAMVSDDPDFAGALSAEYYALLDLYNSGTYQLDSPFPAFGLPALNDPDGDSELIPGFSNIQAGMALGAYPGYPGTYYHFVGGFFDEFGVPTGLRFSDLDMWVDFMVSGPPYESLRFIIDYESCLAEPEVAPWDDYIHLIDIPVLYLAAVGGAGEYSSNFLDLIASTDITRIDVGFLSPEEIFEDFGHVDLFIANDSPELVFEPILNWVETHTE